MIPIALRILRAFGSEDPLWKESTGGLEMATYSPWDGHRNLLSWNIVVLLFEVFSTLLTVSIARIELFAL